MILIRQYLCVGFKITVDNQFQYYLTRKVGSTQRFKGDFSLKNVSVMS